MQLLSMKEYPVYSATNPSADRFDVVLVEGQAVRQKLELSEETSDEASWFPPHRYHYAACVQCGVPLGWFYVGIPEARESDFAGLIVTRLRPRYGEEATRTEATSKDV